MTGVHFTSSSVPLGALTKGQWYTLEQGSLNATSQQPVNGEGVFSVAFGTEFNEQLIAQLLEFFSQHHCEVAQLCYYQADSALPPALCFYTPKTSKAINPLSLKAFSEAQGYQLVQVSLLPNLAEPGLLVMDMDSTAITIECIDEIARLANVYDEVASVTAEAMAGKLDFSQSLHQRVAKLTGIEQSLIDELKLNLPLMPGIKELCQVLKQHNWYLAIASGGFVPFAERVQQLIGLDEVHANVLEFSDNKLTGKVLGTIVDAQQKAKILKQLQQQLNLPSSQTVAIGDGANDLVMMSQAGLGVAVHGKPKVVEQATAAICQGSLLQLLYLLTIPHSPAVGST